MAHTVVARCVHDNLYEVRFSDAPAPEQNWSWQEIYDHVSGSGYEAIEVHFDHRRPHHPERVTVAVADVRREGPLPRVKPGRP